ncbi:MAG TPA: DUF4173 domain-containing protein [Gemmatimonadaceae bacterium]|nr:DUF4173 domain-containing protein [Gemmatimonadaceae bacterium]
MATTLDPRDATLGATHTVRRVSTRVARSVAVSALALGVLGDALLRQGPLGLGFPLFLGALLYVLARLTRSRGVRWSLGATLLLLPIAVTTATFAWRNSDALVFYNVLALLAALSALAWALLRGDEWEPGRASVGAYLAGAVKSGLSAAVGGFPLLADLRLGELARDEARSGPLRHWPAVGRGAAITIPLLLLFGMLFSAADPVFDHLVHDVLDVDVGLAASHVVLIGFFAWSTAGYLRGAAVAPIDDRVRHGERPSLGLGIIEVGLGLAALDVLFLIFVVIQLRYLFGGAAHVQATAHMTYAEYARRGFFELVWVTAFALATLLAANGALRRERRRDEWIFRGLSWTLLALLAVVMLSALQRMRLYQSEYGLTETRFYATVCMGWLAVVLAWFAATVLRGRGTPAFAFGALVSAWLAVAALDVANPDAIIARTNLARLERGARFDPSYVRTLSADATPVIAGTFATLPASMSAPDRCELEQSLVRWRRVRSSDWRGWNAARERARDIAESPRFAGLRQLDCSSLPGAPAGRGG